MRRVLAQARKELTQLVRDRLALGLALRAQLPRGRINFRKGEFAFKQDLSQVRGRLVRFGVAAALLLVLGSVLLFVVLAGVMMLTRRVDWYQVLGTSPPAPQAAA